MRVANNNNKARFLPKFFLFDKGKTLVTFLKKKAKKKEEEEIRSTFIAHEQHLSPFFQIARTSPKDV